MIDALIRAIDRIDGIFLEGCIGISIVLLIGFGGTAVLLHSFGV